MSEEGVANIDFAGQLKDRQKTVNDLLMKKSLKDALMASLENPPIGAKDIELQRESADVVARVLSEYKEADMKETADALSQEQIDLLMKYLYRALETGKNASAPLFKWHKVIVDKSGTGPIVRALVERKTL